MFRIYPQAPPLFSDRSSFEFDYQELKSQLRVLALMEGEYIMYDGSN